MIREPRECARRLAADSECIKTSDPAKIRERRMRLVERSPSARPCACPKCGSRATAERLTVTRPGQPPFPRIVIRCWRPSQPDLRPCLPVLHDLTEEGQGVDLLPPPVIPTTTGGRWRVPGREPVELAS